MYTVEYDIFSEYPWAETANEIMRKSTGQYIRHKNAKLLKKTEKQNEENK